MGGTASVFLSLEFAAYIATTETARGLYLDTDDERTLHEVFSKATFKHMDSEPAGLVLAFPKTDDGFSALDLLAYWAEEHQDMCGDGEHSDSYRQACKEMAPGLKTAAEMLERFLNEQEVQQ